MSEVVCEICKASLASKYSLKVHLETNKACLSLRNLKLESKFNCVGCNVHVKDNHKLQKHQVGCKEYQKILVEKEVKDRYENKCKELENEKTICIKEFTQKILFLENENDRIKSYYNQIVDDLKLQNNNLIVCFQQIVSQAIDKPDIKISQGKDVNNQLIDIIVNKTKTIEDLKDKAKQKNDKMIILNDVCISFRQTDNYINATQLCKAGNKIFDEWVCLETTIQLINELEDVTSLQLIENDKTYYWVHPDIALQLANWISVSFYSDLCKWFRMNNTILISKDKELKIKDEKIHLLENLRVKKQKRSNYPNNVVYIITTVDNKDKRIYIVGKAKILKNRLSAYNKTSEHEVVYYKECEDEEQMTSLESVVLKKLEKYREKSNRDRFVLPIDNDISLFTTIVDETFSFLNK